MASQHFSFLKVGDLAIVKFNAESIMNFKFI